MNVLVSMVVIFLSINIASAQQSRIIFLEAKLIAGKLEYVSSGIVPGKMKVPKKQPLMANHLYFTALNSLDDEISSGLLQDPSQQFVEYVDQERELKTKKISQDSTRIFIRLPYHPDIRKVKIEKIEDRPLLEWLFGKSRETIGVITLNLDQF